MFYDSTHTSNFNIPPPYQNSSDYFAKEPPSINASNYQDSSMDQLLIKVMVLWASYRFVDAGLARFLGLETLTHGTGPLGFIGIQLFGADPKYGGGSTGSSIAIGGDYFVKNSKNLFHVFKDSELESYTEYMQSTLAVKMHAVGSGMANFGYSQNKINTANLARGIIGGVLGFLTPTLKFRFRPEEVLQHKLDLGWDKTYRFKNDPDYGVLAYTTSKKISPLRLGISGCLTQGIDQNTYKRMRNNPQKVLSGACMIALGIILHNSYF